MMDGSPGLLTTRPLIFDHKQIYLFVNAIIQPGGFLQVAVPPPVNLYRLSLSLSLSL